MAVRRRVVARGDGSYGTGGSAIGTTGTAAFERASRKSDVNRNRGIAPTALSSAGRLSCLQRSATIQSSSHARMVIMEYETVMALTFAVFVIIVAVALLPTGHQHRRNFRG